LEIMCVDFVVGMRALAGLIGRESVQASQAGIRNMTRESFAAWSENLTRIRKMAAWKLLTAQ